MLLVSLTMKHYMHGRYAPAPKFLILTLLHLPASARGPAWAGHVPRTA